MRGLIPAAALSLVTPFLISAVGADATAAPPGWVRGDACGSAVWKDDDTRWRCTFVDGFAGDQLNRDTWVPQTQMLSGSGSALGCYADDPSTVSVAGGTLRLSVRRAPEPVACAGQVVPYISGSVSTFYTFSQQYGRFEARIKVAATDQPGLHEAFWLWPDVRVPSSDLWPAAGEIDIAETYSAHPGLAIPFLHYTFFDNGGPVPGLNTAWDCAAERGAWNTYTLTWTATRIEIVVNGRTCLVNTSGDRAFNKPYILALTQALGSVGNGYTGSAPMPATMQVDYVKVWS